MQFKLVFYVSHPGRPEGHTSVVDWMQVPFEIDPEVIAEVGKRQKAALSELTDEQIAMFEREAVGEIIQAALISAQTYAKIRVSEYIAAAKIPAV